MLLLHGVCSTAETLAVLAQAFRSRGFEVSAPTLAARQRTDQGSRDGSLALLRLSDLLGEARGHARDLARRHGVPPVVVGHSNGALLALALAGIGEASAVGMAAPAPPPSVPGAPIWLRHMLFSRVFGSGWPSRAVRFEPRWPFAGDMQLQRLAGTLRPDSGPAMAEAVSPARGGVFDPEPPLPCPATVVAGSRDLYVPLALTRRLASRFDAGHVEVGAAGHWLIHDPRHAAVVCTAVLALLPDTARAG